jgi:hypothetical protein
VPTSAAGKGTIRGIIVHLDTKKPLTDNDGATLYLAGIINGEFRTAGLDKTTAPRATPDTQGNFMFSNIEPGEYAIAIASPISEFLLHEANDQSKDLIIKVEPDKTLDLGTITSKFP